MTTGLYAGSFDPLHLGHLSLIEVAARWCDPLYVVAAANPAKPDGFFDLEERRRVVEASTAHLVNVVALGHTGLIVDLARHLDVDVLIRGVGKDRIIEFEMAAANMTMSGIPTIFLPPDASTGAIASRAVRAGYALGGPDAIAHLVPPSVLDALHARSPVTSS